MSNRNTDDDWTIGNYKNNRYRYVDDYFEVEIFGGGEYHIGQIDKEFLNRFTERTWVADKQGTNIFYMKSNKTTKFPVDQRFHRLVLTGVDIVDHRNGNGLDNRKKNLRDCSGGVNENNMALNKTNTSGANGVSFSKTKQRWVAQWHENGIQQHKWFSIKKYGSDEKAKQKAIEHRKSMDKITLCTNGTRSKAN